MNWLKKGNNINTSNFNTKIIKIEKKITNHIYAKHITTHKLNKLRSGNFTARIKQAN